MRRTLSFLFLLFTLTPTLFALNAPKNKPAQRLTFHPDLAAWTQTEDATQSVRSWTFRKQTDFQIVQHITSQTLGPSEPWSGVLKKHCSLMNPELSGALQKNLPAVERTQLAWMPACRVRMQTGESILEHYFFVWQSEEQKKQGKYEGHTLTVKYPPGFFSRGHEALEKLLSTLRIPEQKP